MPGFKPAGYVAGPMLALGIEDFTLELKDGSLKNVGPPTKTASAKLFDVTEAEARAFGDRRVKLSFADESGNEIEVALSPEQALAVVADVEALEADSPVFE